MVFDLAGVSLLHARRESPTLRHLRVAARLVVEHRLRRRWKGAGDLAWRARVLLGRIRRVHARSLRGALTRSLVSFVLRRPSMNKLSLLLPIVLFACGSEVADGNKAPGADEARAPGQTSAPAADVADAPVPTGQGSSRDHDVALPSGRGFPSITPAPSTLPASNPTPASDPSATEPSTPTTEPSTEPTTPTSPTTEPSTEPSTEPTPTTSSSGECAPTSSGNFPKGKSNGSGSQDGEGSSTWACGGPL